MRQEDILNLLKEHGELTCREMLNLYHGTERFSRSGNPLSNLTHQLKQLSKYHIVEVCGSVRNGSNGHPMNVWRLCR